MERPLGECIGNVSDIFSVNLPCYVGRHMCCINTVVWNKSQLLAKGPIIKCRDIFLLFPQYSEMSGKESLAKWSRAFTPKCGEYRGHLGQQRPFVGYSMALWCPLVSKLP